MHKDGWPRWWCDSCRGALTLKQACGGLEREVMPISHSYTLSWLEPLTVTPSFVDPLQKNEKGRIQWR